MFERPMMQDPGDIIAKLKSAISTLPNETDLFSNCNKLLSDASFMGNSASVKNLMKAITSIEKYEAALKNLDSNSDILKNNEVILSKVYDELSNIVVMITERDALPPLIEIEDKDIDIPAMDSFIEKTEKSTNLIRSLVSFHFNFQAMNLEEKKSSLFLKSKNLYEAATRWIYNGLISKIDFDDNITDITDSLSNASKLINNRNSVQFVNDEIASLKKNTLLKDKLEQRKEKPEDLVREVSVDLKDQFKNKPFVIDDESNIEENESSELKLPLPDEEEFEQQLSQDYVVKEDYIAAVSDFVEAGIDFITLRISTHIEQLRKDIVSLVGDNIHADDKSTKLSFFRRSLSVSDALTTIKYHFDTELFRTTHNNLVQKAGDAKNIPSFLDSQSASVKELLEFKELVQLIAKRKNGNDKIIIAATEKKFTQFVKLLQNNKDLSEFTRSLKNANQLFENLNKLKESIETINLDEENIDPNKKENLELIYKVGNAMYLDCEKSVFNLLNNHKPKNDQIDFLNRCLKDAADAIKNQGKPEVVALVAKLDNDAREAPGYPSFGKKLSASLKILIGAIVIGLGIAGIPFTLGTSAVIGVSAGGGLLASGGAYLFYKGMRRGLSKKLHRLANELDKSHPEYKAPSFGSQMKGYFLNSVTRTKNAEIEKAKPELKTLIPERLSEDQKVLLGKVLNDLANNTLDPKLALEIYQATLKSTPPENATLRNFIIQHVAPHLENQTLFIFAQAVMQAQLDKFPQDLLLRNTDLLSTALYTAFEKQKQPEAMAVLNQMVLKRMEEMDQKPTPSQAAANGIFFLLQGTIPSNTSLEYESLLTSLANESKAVFANKQPSELKIDLNQSVIIREAKEINSLAILNSALLELVGALQNIAGDVTQALSDVACADCKEFSSSDNATQLMQRQSHFTKIYTRVIQAANPQLRLGIMQQMITDTEIPKFQMSENYKTALLSFIVHRAINELKENNPQELVYSIQLSALCEQGPKLCEQFKNNLAALTDLASLLVTAAIVCHNPATKPNLESAMNKMKIADQNNPLHVLQEPLSELTKTSARKNSLAPR